MALSSFFDKLKGRRLYAFAASCLSTALLQFSTFLLPLFHSKVVFDILVGFFWVLFVFFSIYRQCFFPSIFYIFIMFLVEIGYFVLAIWFSYYLVTTDLDPRCVLCLDHQFMICQDPCAPNRLLSVFAVVLFICFAIINATCAVMVCSYAHHLAGILLRESMSSTNISTNTTTITDDNSRKLTKTDLEANESLLLSEVNHSSGA